MIVIDPGHGGEDPGAVGSGLVEKDMNLAISLAMYNRFNELNIPVAITRTTDVTVTPSERVQRILSAFGNNPGVIVISNHINSSGGEGAEVIYALRNTSRLSNLVLEELNREGQTIRKAYQRRLPSNPSQDYYFIHRDTGVTEPIIVEYGFIDNPADVAQVQNNYEDFAEAVVRAVLRYRNIPYTPPAGVDIYVVQPGDSLWSISKRLGITVEELKAANNLTSNLLSVGQSLRVPTQQEVPTPGEYIEYIVRSGDSLYSIARQYGTTVNDLIEFNNLSTSNLSIGQVLRISTLEVVPPTTPPESEYITYRVEAGDNLYSIARRYNTTVSEIMTLNNLTSNALSIGQELLIPVLGQSVPTEQTPTETTEYIVRSGDNLYSIARQFNTSVDDIKRKNNLTSNLLNIGQILVI
ncbi:MAG: LysM peptidoglycan-binding domain-containing protein [Bacilli bacterium]|nr:LysM peptidoglycan-binding domain-containing protein [Bacilli bacterium]MDD4809053.1 LysM peptidoglycan-binding domain-containing protein [Bacilli bacterium]